jgi:hypothetical protein
LFNSVKKTQIDRQQQRNIPTLVLHIMCRQLFVVFSGQIPLPFSILAKGLPNNVDYKLFKIFFIFSPKEVSHPKVCQVYLAI